MCCGQVRAYLFLSPRFGRILSRTRQEEAGLCSPAPSWKSKSSLLLNDTELSMAIMVLLVLSRDRSERQEDRCREDCHRVDERKGEHALSVAHGSSRSSITTILPTCERDWRRSCSPSPFSRLSITITVILCSHFSPIHKTVFLL